MAGLQEMMVSRGLNIIYRQWTTQISLFNQFTCICTYIMQQNKILKRLDILFPKKSKHYIFQQQKTICTRQYTKPKISKTERGLSIEHICERVIFFICIYQNIMLQSINKFDPLYIHKTCTYALDLD